MGRNITKMLYFFLIDNRAILTNGFTKKTQKAPAEEIGKAKRYRAEFLERMEDHDKL